MTEFAKIIYAFSGKRKGAIPILYFLGAGAIILILLIFFLGEISSYVSEITEQMSRIFS